jgi:ribonuclease P protein component
VAGEASTPGRWRFPKELRLRRRSEFLRVQDKGMKIPADCLLALVLPARPAVGSPASAPNPVPVPVTRVGFTVSTKVGNAVVRNRIRRRLRELFRKRRQDFPKGLDMVLVARQSAAEADLARLTSSFERVVVELKKRFKS